jgi:hypothetical protein
MRSLLNLTPAANCTLCERRVPDTLFATLDKRQRRHEDFQASCDRAASFCWRASSASTRRPVGGYLAVTVSCLRCSSPRYPEFHSVRIRDRRPVAYSRAFQRKGMHSAEIHKHHYYCLPRLGSWVRIPSPAPVDLPQRRNARAPSAPLRNIRRSASSRLRWRCDWTWRKIPRPPRCPRCRDP